MQEFLQRIRNALSSTTTYTANPVQVGNSQTNIDKNGQVVTNTVGKSPVAMENISSALRDIESTGGTDPNTPGNTVRSMTVPGLNQNEKDKFIKYQVGYGGQYGITPVALADILKSKADKTSAQNKYGYTKFTPGADFNTIQKNLLASPESAGQVARDIFMSKKASSTDMTPETLTNDYMENYLTKASPNYNDANRQRVLNIFKKYAGQ